MKRSYTSLTTEELQTLKDKKILNGCGGMRTYWLIPDFIFCESCNQHDFYYERGGDIFDKMEADLMFVAHMLKQINNHHSQWYKKILHTLLAGVYFIAVSVLGLFGWEWGEYRTLEEIINNSVV
jgi:hypothetical protein